MPSWPRCNSLVSVLTAAPTEYNGRFLSDAEPVTLDDLQAYAISSRDAKKLWKLTEELVGQKFEY